MEKADVDPAASRPEVEPLDVTGVRTVAVGTVLFLLAFLALLPLQGWLAGHDRTWWLWTCLAGFGLGLFGLYYCRRRARRSSASGRAADSSGPRT